MRLVDDQKEIVGEIVDERGRRIARVATGEVARIVLDAVAETHLLEHLEVVHGPLFETLLLEKATGVVVVVEALTKLVANRADGFAELLLLGDVVRAWEDRRARERADDFAAKRIDLFDGLDLVAEELDADRDLLFVRGKNFDDVAADADTSRGESRRRCARIECRPDDGGARHAETRSLARAG